MFLHKGAAEYSRIEMICVNLHFDFEQSSDKEKKNRKGEEKSLKKKKVYRNPTLESDFLE